jgi:hypothetical protein
VRQPRMGRAGAPPADLPPPAAGRAALAISSASIAAAHHDPVISSSWWGRGRWRVPGIAPPREFGTGHNPSWGRHCSQSAAFGVERGSGGPAGKRQAGPRPRGLHADCDQQPSTQPQQRRACRGQGRDGGRLGGGWSRGGQLRLIDARAPPQRGTPVVPRPSGKDDCKRLPPPLATSRVRWSVAL